MLQKTPDSISTMFNQIANRYDRLNRLLSFGIDRYWRRQLLSHLPEKKHLQLIDLATGTCDQLIPLMRSKKFRGAVGIDFAQEMLSIGEKKLSKTPFAKRVELKCASAEEIPVESGGYDVATISFGIRNVENPLACLREMRRVLAPGGKAMILEFSLPSNPLVRKGHLFYLRKVLPKIGGWISGKKSAYTYLNQTIETFPYGQEFLALMEDAGFTELKSHPLTFGIATLYVGTCP